MNVTVYTSLSAAGYVLSALQQPLLCCRVVTPLDYVHTPHLCTQVCVCCVCCVHVCVLCACVCVVCCVCVCVCVCVCTCVRVLCVDVYVYATHAHTLNYVRVWMYQMKVPASFFLLGCMRESGNTLFSPGQLPSCGEVIYCPSLNPVYAWFSLMNTQPSSTVSKIR